jgi:ABC-type multidrug transport system fused ATPase/permease subunit
MTAPGPRSGAVSGNPASPAHVNRDTARRVVPLFRPYRAQVAAVVGLIVVTSTIGIINPLLIQVVFNKALFVPGGPDLHLLVILVVIMAVVPIVNGAIGIVQTYETTRVGQQVMRDLRDRLYAHLQTLPLAFFTGTKTGEIQSRLANDVGGVQSVVTTTASSILANVVIFVSTIVAMIILSWQLTIVAVITVPVFFWLTKTVGERRRQVARSTQESLAAMSALSEETQRTGSPEGPRCPHGITDHHRHRHRLSTIINASVINVIDAGRVVESGDHRSLLGQGGVYASLYQEQFEGGKIQWRCPDGDIMADGTIRQRQAQPA